MKHVGIVGVSAEGASLCYKTIVSESSKMLGANIHPEITLNNPSFSEIIKAQNKKDWGKVTDILLESVSKLKKAGADFAVIPANSVHFAIDALNKNTKLPIISIVDATVQKCFEGGYKKVLVLGIGITMSDGLYDKKLKEMGIMSVTPKEKDQKEINMLIYSELVQGVFKILTINYFLKLINNYKKQGCDAVILGCTELPLILNDKISPIPTLDTTDILAKEAVKNSIDIK